LERRGEGVGKAEREEAVEEEGGEKDEVEVSSTKRVSPLSLISRVLATANIRC